MSTHVLQPALETLKREFDAGCQTAAERAQADLLHRLNQQLRRFRQYESEADWLRALLDSACSFADQIAIFSVDDSIVRLRLQANLNLPPNFSFRLAQARAFASACDLKDPVTALRTPGEMTARLSENRPEERAHLFPIMNDSRVAAVLFAAGPANLDMNALELVCGMAGMALERSANKDLHSHIGPILPIAGYRTAPAAVKPLAPEIITPRLPDQILPAWADLAIDQRQLHVRAQRFARVAVAEFQLARPEACKAGREQGDLYLFLKAEIDKARESYRQQFMIIPSMIDYLHLELIRTAAEGDERKLGADYPGQLL